VSPFWIRHETPFVKKLLAFSSWHLVESAFAKC
jgi:hypothetical protein